MAIIRDTFSNDCFSSVMLVFGDVYIRDQIGKTLYPTNKKLGTDSFYSIYFFMLRILCAQKLRIFLV